MADKSKKEIEEDEEIDENDQFMYFGYGQEEVEKDATE
jgi:hypothetical protein